MITNIQYDDKLSKNVPSRQKISVQKNHFGQSGKPRRYIKKEQIKEIAKSKYRQNGSGITYRDIIENLRISKPKAQRTLKHFHTKKFLFTAQDLKSQDIHIKGMKRENPQRYYLSEMKAEIINNRKDNVLNDTTGTMSINTPSKTDLLRAQNFQHVLAWLPEVDKYIHNMQLAVYIDKKYYDDIDVKADPVNKSKIIEERIGPISGPANIIFTIYANGTVMIHIKNSENPFRLMDESDVIHIMSFLGRVEERLHDIFHDPRDRIVPSVKYWILKECDVNKDVEIDSLAQITLHNMEIPLADKALRGYVKAMGGKAFFRMELAMIPNEYVNQALEKLRIKTKIDSKIVLL